MWAICCGNETVKQRNLTWRNMCTVRQGSIKTQNRELSIVWFWVTYNLPKITEWFLQRYESLEISVFWKRQVATWNMKKTSYKIAIAQDQITTAQTNKLCGLWSASELYRLTTATCWRNLVPTFADRGVSHGPRGGSPTVVKLSFLDRSRYFSFK
jgi:hypothetical protein